MGKPISRFKDVLKLVASVTICQLAGSVGSVFTVSAIPNWYAGLNKPLFSPPNWVFGPVWITLYLMLGVSLYLVWRRGLEEKKVKDAILVFEVQLLLNALWSIAFFGGKSPITGLIVIALLWCAILLNIRRFWSISKTAAALLGPYFLWVSFATILNLSILLLNQ